MSPQKNHSASEELWTLSQEEWTYVDFHSDRTNCLRQIQPASFNSSIVHLLHACEGEILI